MWIGSELTPLCTSPNEESGPLAKNAPLTVQEAEELKHVLTPISPEAEQIPTVSVDYGFFGQPEDRAHDTLPVLIVRDRKSKGIRSHSSAVEGCDAPVSCKGSDG